MANEPQRNTTSPTCGLASPDKRSSRAVALLGIKQAKRERTHNAAKRAATPLVRSHEEKPRLFRSGALAEHRAGHCARRCVNASRHQQITTLRQGAGHAGQLDQTVTRVNRGICTGVDIGIAAIGEGCSVLSRYGIKA